jgi:hypothetical protein
MMLRKLCTHGVDKSCTDMYKPEYNIRLFLGFD